MQRELLHALLGRGGGVARWACRCSRHARSASPELQISTHACELAMLPSPAVSDSDREIATRLLRLGSWFDFVSAFCDARSDHAECGLYAAALCGGLREMLSRYRAAVVAIEQQLIEQDGAMSLSAMRVAMERVSHFPPASAILLLLTPPPLCVRSSHRNSPKSSRSSPPRGPTAFLVVD
jgi:hypothetical protein